MIARIALVILSLVFSCSIGSSQTDPLDLARGLREIGMPDLALEYIDELAKQSLPADVRTVLPLERARTHLALAQLESEESVRDAGVAAAKSQFELFIKANPNHPRVPEAKLAQAQVTAMQAVGQLHRTRKISGKDAAETRKKRVEAQAAVRPLFLEASKLFGEASRGIDALIQSPSVPAARKSELYKASLQAELDRGINQYRLVDTYPPDVQGADVKRRGEALDAARKIFIDLGRKDETSAICWQARAWAGICEYDKSDRAAAEKIFTQIRNEAPRTAAGADGIRMVEFFEAYIKYDEALASRNRNAITLARAQARTWLDNDRYRPRMTPQRLSMTFYYAYLTELLGLAEIQFEKPAKKEEDKPQKVKAISGQGLAYLKEAAREFKRLVEFDNQYTEPAQDHRNRVVRLIVGDEPKEPSAYSDLEECQMACMVQLKKAGESKAAAMELDPESPEGAAAKERADAEFAKAIALAERAKELLKPDAAAREIMETRFNQALVHYSAENFTRAATLAEELARSGKGGFAARAGLIAVDSHFRHWRQLTDAAAKSAAREKALALGHFLDKTHSSEPATDGVRLRLGQFYAQEKDYPAAFDILSRVNSAFGEAAMARALEAEAAFHLLTTKDSPLTDARRAEIFQQVVSDCRSLPIPSTGPALKSYFAMKTMLAYLFLTDRPNGFTEAERIATENLKAITDSPLDAGEKTGLSIAAEEARLRAIYAQGSQQFEEGKYKELAATLEPALIALKAAKSAASSAEGEARRAAASLDAFRREFVVLAMRGHIRRNEFDQATQLFELLDRFGGSTEAITQTLNRFVALVRPEIDSLRKAKRDEEADKLGASIGLLLQQQAEKANLPARTMASLGRSLRDLGQYDRAVEVLKKVPVPSPEHLQAKISTLQEADRDAVTAYSIAQIELARAYRMSRRFDEAEKVLLAALGDEKSKTTGWSKSLEFKKEGAYFLEDKAASLPAEPKQARQQAWNEAKLGWERIANQYAALLRLPIVDPNNSDPKIKGITVNERERIVPIYLELLCDLRRCLARGNSQLLADNPEKLADAFGKIAQAVVEVESSNADVLTAEIRAKYKSFLNEYPAIRDEYRKRGGKAFLDAEN